MTGPMQKQMKDAQRMMKELMEQQEKLQSATYEAASGGGMVTASVNGKFELLSLKIEKECIDPNDPEMMADLVRAAVNEAIRRAQEAQSQSIAGMTAGLKLPF
ncbi:MAG: YbaB/EbfC family nucleoid-associated protein [Candidatus Wallbacteria bacterium]|nr:YbaB/EbfC family nucleoid-associated protein [Candidatus Wallbacteria bacterium]